MNARTITLKTSLFTGAALIALWIASWGISYADLGTWSLVVALVIAAAKAILVALFFMELLVEKPTFNMAIVSALLLIGILISFVVADVATRRGPNMTPPRATHPTERMGY